MRRRRRAGVVLVVPAEQVAEGLRYLIGVWGHPARGPPRMGRVTRSIQPVVAASSSRQHPVAIRAWPTRSNAMAGNVIVQRSRIQAIGEALRLNSLEYLSIFELSLPPTLLPDVRHF